MDIKIQLNMLNNSIIKLEEKVKSYNKHIKTIPLEYKDWKTITPKRKTPCPCWSGKKYKRCCWE